MRNVKKGAMLALLSGAMLFQGCLGGWWSWVLQGVGGSLVTEWLTDNDGVFDLFEDGDVAAAE